MITTATRPLADTVLYDGQCRFCRSQIAMLRRFDLGGRRRFVSLHDPEVAHPLRPCEPGQQLAGVQLDHRDGVAAVPGVVPRQRAVALLDQLAQRRLHHGVEQLLSGGGRGRR